MKLNLFLFLKKAVSHVSVFYVCQPIIFNLFILIILNLVTVSFDFYLAFTAPDEGEFCLTEILGNKIITLLSCPISLAIGFLFYSTLLILIYTKIRLHLATVCPRGPCIELPDLASNNILKSLQDKLNLIDKKTQNIKNTKFYNLLKN